MTGGSIIVAAGALVALIAPLFLPFLTVDEAQVGLHGPQLATGIASLVVAAATLALAGAVWRWRRRRLGWAIGALSIGQIALMAGTYAAVWPLVPCERLGLGMCDPQTGGLIDQTLVTFGAGAVLVVVGGLAAFLGGLLVAAAPAEYRKEDRFLRVMLTWDGHILHERVFFRPEPVTVGEADGATFQLAARGLASHMLLAPVARRPDRYQLEVPRGVDGKLQVGGATRQASELTSIEISRGDTGLLGFDNGVGLAFQFTGAEPGGLAGAGTDRGAGLAVSFAAVSAAMLVLVAAMLADVRRGQRQEYDEPLDPRGREHIEVTLEDPVAPLEPITPPGEELDTTGKRAGGEEGAPGDPDTDSRKVTKIPKRDGRMAESVDVRTLGVAAALNQAPGGALGTVLSGDAGTMDARLAVAVATAGDGTELVIGGGPGGMGFRGTGKGGGDQGFGRLHGMGPIDTGGGTGRLANVGIGRKRGRRAPPPLPGGDPQTTAGCDKGDIQKQVRARASALRACYEAQLLARPDLAGKVTVLWTISTEGTVAGAKTVSDTLDSHVVTDCVLRAIRHIRFAAPEAGICVIQWPFVFTPG